MNLHTSEFPKNRVRMCQCLCFVSVYRSFRKIEHQDTQPWDSTNKKNRTAETIGARNIDKKPMSIATAMSHNTNNQTCGQPSKRTRSHTQAWEKKRERLTNKRPNGQPSMTVTTTTTPSTATTLQGILNITLERRGISVQTRCPHLCLLVHGP